jgi:putative transcriptional regulator
MTDSGSYILHFRRRAFLYDGGVMRMRLESMLRLGWARLVQACLIGLVSASALAQTPAAGTLLVASPDLPDPNFTETVLLLLHHDDNGSLAIFVNRPTWVEPGAAYAGLGLPASYTGRVFLGGPIEPGQLLMLVRSPPDTIESTAIVGDVHLSADVAALSGAAFAGATDSRVRLYAGHVAWGRGQLEAEIASGGWKVVDARAEDVFSADPLELWERLSGPGRELVVSRQPARPE